jgi:exodeoxyribonuclease V alpha subunit
MKDIVRLYNQGIISNLDLYFGLFVERLAGKECPGLTLAAGLVSSRTRQGDICLDLTAIEGQTLIEGNGSETRVVCPQLEVWCRELKESGVVGGEGEYKPLILDGRPRLYLFRYWDYQEKLTSLIKSRICDDAGPLSGLREALVRLFPGDPAKEEVDWQKIAAFTAAHKRFCVISGGPGTGKTTTVARILALLLERQKDLRVALAAPTGKAAVRMQEAVTQAKKSLNCGGNIRDAIPENASTIHRLLGSVKGSPYFRHHSGNPLPIDMVVVDEASMVDLALMSKLIQAVPDHARLVLLGDRDQLASVEAGAVLGDICDTGCTLAFSWRFRNDLEQAMGYRLHGDTKEAQSPMRDCIVELRKGYRFGVDSGIGVVSQAVRDGDEALALSLLRGEHADISWKGLPVGGAFRKAIAQESVRELGDYLRCRDPLISLALLNRFRILCALREGPYGALAVNALVEDIFRKEKLIRSEGAYYAGRPIMVTVNAYPLELFNGDVGVILPDPGVDNDLRAFFPAPGGGVRQLHPVRLPPHETAYAMTVHKSQGSEFHRVLLILPDRDSPVLTRELIYTGITRGMEHVELWGSESVLRGAVSRRIARRSGLRDALWEA